MSSAQVDREAIFREVYAPGAPPPRLSALHLALFRRLRVDWSPVESGAPGIYPFQPLLGQGSALHIARSILKNPDPALAVRLLAELNLLVVPIIEQADFAPGRYCVPLEQRENFDTPASGVDAQGYFELQPAHVKLVKRALWRVPDGEAVREYLAHDDCWPMPVIDGKRPYGDFTWFQVDMARILGEPYRCDAIGYPIDDEAKDERLERLHFQTLPALQVMFACAQIKL